MGQVRTIKGQVRFVEPLVAPGGTLHVRVEDVSRTDAASRVVAETSIRLDNPVPAGGDIPFELAVPDVDDRAHYSVRVHVDINSSNEVTPGDRISTAAYPVLTRGHPNSVIVKAQKI